MRIDVRFQGIEASDALREHVVRRIRFQLSRFSGEVSAVVVRIGDVNGPKGGVDKRCHVAVRGPAFAPVTIEDLGSDAYSTVDLAVGRAARAVRRRIARARAARRDRAPGRTS